MQKSALKLTDSDNVATALFDIVKGDDVIISDSFGKEIDVVKALDDTVRGHKIALIDIAMNERIVKYSHQIGTASQQITRGEHVHTHNLMSARGRGDL